METSGFLIYLLLYFGRYRRLLLWEPASKHRIYQPVDIVKYYDGLLLRIPNKENPTVLEEVVKQEKMLDVFKEHLRWNYIMGLSNVGDFNLACEEGHATDLINVAEALQEKKIAQIADEIYHRGENGNRVKLVLISGPSSSGKTTFSKRLSVQLMTNGLRPYPISLDNYFVDREETPRDENGNYDYDRCMHSILSCSITNYRHCSVVKK